MPTPVGTRTGSCLCGAVTYTLTGEPLNKVLCHCTNCKKATGAPFMANGFYLKTQLTIHTATTLRHYFDSNTRGGTAVERTFCGTCGSSVFIYTPKFEPAVIIPTGTMDGIQDAEWDIKEEFFCEDRVKWMPELGGSRKHMGMRDGDSREITN